MIVAQPVRCRQPIHLLERYYLLIAVSQLQKQQQESSRPEQQTRSIKNDAWAAVTSTVGMVVQGQTALPP